MKSFAKCLCAIVILLLYTAFPSSTSFADNDSVSTDSTITEAECAVLIDAATGIVIYDKNKDERCYPASTTKVMTALLTIEYVEARGGDYSERILFSENAVFGIERNSNHIAMDVDETLTIEDALYAVMLASANEVSAALAEHIGGSIEGFAAMMNARAAELGLQNTHFVNPHGLDNADHYTTAADLAAIMREAVKHDMFLRLISTKQRFVPPTEKQPEERPLNNSNRLILGGLYYDARVVGGKTGYTDDARHTLVSYAQEEDTAMICAVMKAEKDVPYKDTIKLYDYGFGLYQPVTLLEAGSYETETEIYAANGQIKRFTLVPAADVTVCLPFVFDPAKIEKIPVYETTPAFDVAIGDEAGKLSLVYQGCTLGETALIVSQVSVEEAPAVQQESKEQAVFSQTSPMVNTQESGFNGLPFVIALVLLLVAAVMFLFWRKRQARVAALRLRQKRYR